MENADPNRSSGASTRTAALVTLGIVAILGLALFIGFHIAPLRRTRALVRDVHAWRTDRYRRPELRRILTPFEPPRMRCASGLRSPWWNRYRPPELHPDRLGAPDRAARRLSAYFRMPDREAPHKEEVVYLLGLCGKPAVPTLIDALKHRDSEMRTIAAVSLGRVGADAGEAIDALADTLRNAEDAALTCWVTRALCAIGLESLPALTKALKHDDWGVRHCVTEALWELGSEAVPALIEALQDRKSEVRISAAKSLGLIGPGAKDAVPALAQTLTDQDVHVRLTAAKSLGEIGAGAEPAVPALIGGLRDTDTEVRAWCAYTLECIGPGAKEAIPALGRALNDKSPDVRAAAAEALKKIRGEGEPEVDRCMRELASAKIAIDRTQGHLQDYGGSLRFDDFSEGCDRLWHMGDEAVPKLMKALRSESPNLRRNAAFILALSDSPEVLVTLKRVAKDDAAPRVQEAACWAIRFHENKGHILYVNDRKVKWKGSPSTEGRGE